ncbi:MAG TPA: 30S ribosomal protein S1 [Solibacterales bacterium]|nr:30S ribosomal protein S1 [Bryobacterales bacterium]
MSHPSLPNLAPADSAVPEADSNNPTTGAQAETTAVEEPSFGDILSEYEEAHKAHGEAGGPKALEGRVIAVTAEAVFVDVGRKMEGVIPLESLRLPAGEPPLKPGDVLLVNITGLTPEGNYQLSTVRVERPKDWSGLQTAFAEKRVIAGQVEEVVKGGLRVDIGVRAFMPASRSGARDVPDMEKLVGQEIRCRITKLDVEKEDVVVDRRVVLEEEAKQAREQAFSTLAEGQVVRGTVRSITEFGAFVDLGGVDGLLHVTDMSWGRVGKPADLVSVGDQVDVKILKINPDTKKISLGMKQLQPDPWSQAVATLKVGDRVKGTVARLADFGAFVELLPGVDGLIHVSEMSWSKKIRKPADVLKTGESVDVVVLGVSPAEKRISLGLKQALGDPWDEVPAKYPVGAVVEGPVKNLAPFGAFVELGDGIEGMIHIGDISREKRLDHPREMLSTGQVVKAQVLEIDRERRRLRLGMKQLEPTQADHFMAEHKPGDTVTGRVVEVHQGRAKVELGEGVHAWCRFGEAKKEAASAAVPEGPKASVGDLSAMLAASWKGGRSPAAGSGGGTPGGVRPGQVRNFRIAGLDPANKRIDLELAE